MNAVLKQLIIGSFFFLIGSSICLAETDDFGGYDERFRGGGDKQPPLCQIRLPRASTSTFFVAWDCGDDVSPGPNISTQLWLFRKGQPNPVKLGDFLGFPASVQISEEVFGSVDVESGLPASFRLLARDRAGNAAISPLYTVTAQDNSLETCDVSLITQGTEADGGTTGLESLSVIANSASVTSTQAGDTDALIKADTDPNPIVPNPCEITDICDGDKNEISFSASVTLDGIGGATASFSLSPGDVSLKLTGSAETTDNVLTSVTMTGTTAISEVVTDVSLTCTQ